jgi:hypothetical protein
MVADDETVRSSLVRRRRDSSSSRNTSRTAMTWRRRVEFGKHGGGENLGVLSDCRHHHPHLGVCWWLLFV